MKSSKVRQCGLVAGVELRQPCGQPFPRGFRVGEALCLMAREHGLLTRAIQDTVVIMPPLSIEREEIRTMIASLDAALKHWKRE